MQITWKKCAGVFSRSGVPLWEAPNRATKKLTRTSHSKNLEGITGTKASDWRRKKKNNRGFSRNFDETMYINRKMMSEKGWDAGKRNEQLTSTQRNLLCSSGILDCPRRAFSTLSKSHPLKTLLLRLITQVSCCVRVLLRVFWFLLNSFVLWYFWFVQIFPKNLWISDFRVFTKILEVSWFLSV